jgi:hypothetical protein
MSGSHTANGPKQFAKVAGEHPFVVDAVALRETDFRLGFFLHDCTAFPAGALVKASIAAAMVARSW